MTLAWGSLSGTIPLSFSNLWKLEHLDLQLNLLTGTIPTGFFQKLTSLKRITLSNNLLTGPLQELNSPKVRNIFLDANDFTGSIPNSMYNLPELEILSLSRNWLSGSLSSQLGILEEVNQVSIAYNLLSGTLPTEIGKVNRCCFVEFTFKFVHWYNSIGNRVANTVYSV